MKARVVIQTADRKLEMADHEVPRLTAGTALLEVEACGLCGSDVEQYKGAFTDKGIVTYPLIPGHEPVGRIAEFADQKGVQVVPLAWHTGITAAAALHYQAATINTPAVEYFPTYLFDSPLREHLVSPEAKIVDGKVKLPEGPGLGVTLNEEIISKYGQRT